jgi:hypothetical protein
MLGPFVLALVVALAQVSGTMGVQAVDPVLHAFQAKVYLHDGLFHPVGPNQVVLRYPSGFAAINAVTAGVSFLTPVQAVNLQHIVWIIVGMFLVTGSVAALTGRPLPLLHATPLPFLVLFPIYGLIPDFGYSGTPRQMVPPLLLAVTLLPTVAFGQTTNARIIVVVISMLLAVLTLALNPICAPFTLAAVLVAGVIICLRQGGPLRRTAVAVASLMLAFGFAAVLVLGADRHYAGYLNRQAATAAVTDSSPAVPPLRLSPSVALTAFTTFSPFDLTPTVMLEEEEYGKRRNPAELHWTEAFPQRLVPWLAEALALTALLLALRGRHQAPVLGVYPAALLILACAAMWILLKWGVAFTTAAVSSDSWKADMLQVYLKTILTRIELLLLFTSLAASATLLVLIFESKRGELVRRLAPVAWMALAVLTVGLAVGPHPKSGFFSMPAGSAYAVTAEDRELASWIDENTPPDRGMIGLAATTFFWGPEKHVYALGGAQAVVQYGKNENFRFGMRSLEKNAGFEEYVAHVRDAFDADWCLAHDIRFFYVDKHGLKVNPGLANAIASGKLKSLRQAGDSAIYEVVEGAAP